MKSFKDRKKAFEEKFAKDLDLQFKVECKACKQFGLYIADLLGLAGDDAATYASDVVVANLEEPGLDDVLRKVQADLDAAGVKVAADVLERKLESCIEDAKSIFIEDDD